MPLPRGLVWGAAIVAASSATVYLLNFANSLSPDAPLIETINAIVFETSFGQWWIIRVVFLAGLVASVLVSDLACPVLLFSGVILFSENGLGHAAADGLLSRISIVVHALAAATWLGGLTTLLATIQWRSRNEKFDYARWLQTTRMLYRFSAIGVVAVGLLILTGLFNVWMRLGDFQPRINMYDRMLLLKITLVAAMLCFAILNRTILLPRLVSKPQSHQALRSSMAFEQIAGILVLLITAALGQMSPAG